MIVSAVGQKKMVFDAISKGAKDFIIKPFDPNACSWRSTGCSSSLRRMRMLRDPRLSTRRDRRGRRVHGVLGDLRPPLRGPPARDRRVADGLHGRCSLPVFLRERSARARPARIRRRRGGHHRPVTTSRGSPLARERGASSRSTSRSGSPRSPTRPWRARPFSSPRIRSSSRSSRSLYSASSCRCGAPSSSSARLAGSAVLVWGGLWEQANRHRWATCLPFSEPSR